MSSPGFGKTDASILLFCFNGKWRREGNKTTYTSEFKTETEIDRFLRKSKLIRTDVGTQLNNHLTRLVNEGWLQKTENKYWFPQFELLGISLLILFVATYDPESLEELMSRNVFKESWRFFRGSLFYDIYPFTQEKKSDEINAEIKTVIVEPPNGTENVERILRSKERRKTIEETIGKMQHENSDFNYYLLANPFTNRKLCDILADISLNHRVGSMEELLETKKYADRSLRAQLSRIGWKLGMEKIVLILR